MLGLPPPERKCSVIGTLALKGPIPSYATDLLCGHGHVTSLRFSSSDNTSLLQKAVVRLN